MPPILKESLKNIGLSDKEVRVLLVLLQSGPTLASSVARSTKINRTTTYGLLKELTQRGLVSYSKNDGATKYQSIAPELLPSYIERKGNELQKNAQEIENLVPQIELLRSHAHILPRVQFFEGREGVEQAYEDTLENNKSKELLDITGVDAAFTKLDRSFLNYYLKKRARLGIKCTNLAPETDWARKSKKDDEKYLRITKFLPENLSFDGEISMYDDKVGLFSYEQVRPVAVIIQDQTISSMMKQLFKYMESTLK
jgi:HTH-type transcriptional regulator, sugar sensing transcriptional regulator